MQITKRREVALAVALAFGLAGSVLAIPPVNCNSTKDTLTVTAGESDAGVVPTSPGNLPKNWVYSYCLPSSNSGVNDLLPIDFTLTQGDPGACAPDSITVSFNANGNPTLSGAITVPASFVMNDDGSTTTRNLLINTGALAPGNYNANVQISYTPNGQTTISHDVIHITVEVGAQCEGGEAIGCFFLYQDSLDGLQYLNDCAATPVTGSSGGRFEIVPNKKKSIQVSTNPGQFYYNAFWTNTTGNDMDVTIDFDDMTGAGTQSANALHAEVFPAGLDPLDESDFGAVESGLACGPGGPCTINVPDGYTLWVLWHFNWNEIGGSTSGIPNSCAAADQQINVQVSLYDDQDQLLASCGSNAQGYLKK